MRILFDSRLSQFKSPFGTLHPGQDCRIQIQIPVSCQTVKTELVLLQEDGSTRLIRRAETPEDYFATAIWD